MDSLLSYRNCIDRPERAFILALGYSREEMRGSLSHILKDRIRQAGKEGKEGDRVCAEARAVRTSRGWAACIRKMTLVSAF